MNGRITTLAEKTPANPNDIAWNVAQGGRFDVVRWGDWPLNVCKLACRIFPHTGLNFTGIDIMVDQEDQAWFVEANSAPSLPALSEGSISYRQECMAKGIAYSILEDNSHLTYETNNGWRGYVHPAIWSRD